MEIKIIGRIKKNKNLYFCKYHKSLETAISNFKDTRTVKVLNGVCYIHFTSLGYFSEILSNNHVSYSIITSLN